MFLRGELAKQALIGIQDEEGSYGLPVDEVVTIKLELIGLMTSVPPNIQSQLGEAIGIIADSDFWERWDTLVDVSIGRLKHGSTAGLCHSRTLYCVYHPNKSQ